MYQVFKLVLSEIYQLLTQTELEISYTDEKAIVSYLIRSNPYVTAQVETRLSILEGYDFKGLSESEISDLYHVRTLVGGVRNTFYGFGRNIDGLYFVPNDYILYVSEIQSEIKSLLGCLKDDR